MGIQKSTGSLLDDLRAATYAVHQRLHQHVLLKNLISKQIELTDYIPALLALYGFYIGQQDIIASSTRINWLQKDLKYFQCDFQHITTCKPPRMFDNNAKLGYLYVVEGSSLGGQVIYKNLNKSLGLSNTGGARYFYGHGHTTGKMWRELVHTLQLQRKHSYPAIIQSARDTFDLLEQWLNLSVKQNHTI